MASTDDYVALVTSEHQSKQLFAATIRALTQGLVDQIQQASALPAKFDLDLAVGVQLDAIGQWVGLTRRVPIPLVNVFFSLDAAGVGFDQGSWFSPGDSTTGLVNLDDASYRLMLRAKIGANHWDGTMAGLQVILESVFAGTGASVFAYDNQDMSMLVGIAGVPPAPVQLALLTTGLIIPKPEGVRINYFISSAPGTPLFGFDVNNAYVAGFDVGSFGI